MRVAKTAATVVALFPAPNEVLGLLGATRKGGVHGPRRPRRGVELLRHTFELYEDRWRCFRCLVVRPAGRCGGRHGSRASKCPGSLPRVTSVLVGGSVLYAVWMKATQPCWCSVLAAVRTSTSDTQSSGSIATSKGRISRGQRSSTGFPGHSASSITLGAHPLGSHGGTADVVGMKDGAPAPVLVVSFILVSRAIFQQFLFSSLLSCNV